MSNDSGDLYLDLDNSDDIDKAYKEVLDAL